jgi:hypothetical protein
LLSLIIQEKEGMTMMNEDNPCRSCATGCAARQTDQRESEEIAAGSYLIISGVIIVVVSVIVGWLLQGLR